MDFVRSRTGQNKLSTILLTVLAASKSDEGNSSVELAEWDSSENGYPVSIRYGGLRIQAGNKEELEQAIEGLLMDTAVAKKLKNLLELEEEAGD